VVDPQPAHPLADGLDAGRPDVVGFGHRRSG
jgi:hypothetical protein